MSGQQPQHNPWYGPGQPPQWQPGPPHPPSGGDRRNGGWIVVAVVAVVAVLAGGTFAGLMVFGDSDESGSSADDPATPDPTGPPGEPTPEPTADPAATDPWGSLPADAEVNAVSDAVARAGYACYNALGSPVLVRRCYLEPATDKFDEQTVTIEAAADGSVNAVGIEVDYFDGHRKSEPMFERTLRALTGTVLQGSEVAAIVQGQRPSRHSVEQLAWGKADLFTSEDGAAYHLELVASGATSVAVPAGDVRIDIAAVQQHYTQRGFSCHVQSALNTLRCDRRVQGGALTVLAFDECLSSGPRYESICAGHQVHSLTAAAEFNAGMPEAAYARFFDDFLVPAMNLAADTSTFADEVATSIDDWTKPHRLDVEGLHVEVMPGHGAMVGGYDQALEITVEGVNLTT
ncbi:MAG: hypothetical protein ACRDPQ_06625 [Nocardioidaceae bacterium]